MTKPKPKQSEINKFVSSEIGQQLAEQTFRQLGYDPQTGKLIPSRISPLNTRKLPFQIPALEKTTRQAKSSQGYKASASWQTASLLRDLILLWTPTLSQRAPFTPVYSHKSPVNSRQANLNPGTIARLRTQIEDAARSMVSTFEEGWARPKTREFLDFIGFSQGSLTEVGGDIDRLLADELIKLSPISSIMPPVNSRFKTVSEMKRLGIPTPSRENPYPPLISRKYPQKYGSVRERLREFTGKDIVDPQEFTYELFRELINKEDYLLKRTVEGLQNKIIADEEKKLNQELTNIRRKNW